MTWQAPGGEQNGEPGDGRTHGQDGEQAGGQGGGQGGAQSGERPTEQPYADSPPPTPPGYGEPPAAPGYGTPPPPSGQPPIPPPYGAPPVQDPGHGQSPPPYGQAAGGQPQYGYGQAPYGQPQYGQPQYGQPPYSPPQYGQPPTFGQPPAFGQGYGFGATGLPPGVQFADWGTRLAAYLLDWLVTLATALPALISLGIGAATAPNSLDGSSGSSLPGLFVGLFFVLLLLPVGFLIWNTYRTGATGQSLGKGWMGIHLVSTRSFQPPGPGTAFGKYLIRGVLNGFCGLYIWVTGLWPLWDTQSQTLDDKMVSTYVVRFPGKRLP